MGDFQRCIEIILAEEGGLANHRRDPGGLTIRYFPAQLSRPEHRRPDARDRRRALSPRLLEPGPGDELPDGLDLLVLDSAINQGPATAIKLLQEALGVAVDGVLGPIALANTRRTMPNVLAEFCALRVWRYEINRNKDAFGKGWFRRLFRLFALARDWSRAP